MPVIGCCNSPPNLVVISQYVQIGSLYQVLHEGSGLVVDATAAIQFAIDVAKGMAFLQSLDRQLPRYYLNSRHVMVRNNLDYPLSIKFRRSKLFNLRQDEFQSSRSWTFLKFSFICQDELTKN